MNEECDFYICTLCFSTSEDPASCHGQARVHCGTFKPGDIPLKPLMDDEGNLKSDAPRWFLKQVSLQQGKRWPFDDSK